MNLGIDGKRALVMGASKGLGLAIAKTLCDEGAIVAISSSDKGKLRAASEAIKATAMFEADYTKPGSAGKLVEQTLAALGGIDILVVNTGGPPSGSFRDVDNEQWKAGFQNLWLSAVDAIRETLPGMKQRNWGRILVVTSIAAKEPMGNLIISNGLRAGLLGLIKSLSQEVGGNGITVNALLPGYTMTERIKNLGIDAAKISAQIPIGRLGQPEEFAALATFLASEKAGYITGQAIACDGGYLKGL